MSAKREKKRRAALRREYIEDYNRWLRSEPPKILFWWWRKWKKSRPIWNGSGEPKRYRY